MAKIPIELITIENIPIHINDVLIHQIPKGITESGVYDEEPLSVIVDRIKDGLMINKGYHRCLMCNCYYDFLDIKILSPLEYVSVNDKRTRCKKCHDKNYKLKI